MQNGFECQQGIFRFSIEGANAIQVGGHGLTAGVAWLQERARFADQTLALPEPKPRWGLQHKPRLVQNLDQARAALVKKGQRILQLDNFRKLRGFGWPGFDRMNLWRQDKGQRACAAAFL